MSDVEPPAGRRGGERSGRFGGRSRRGKVSPAAMSRIGLVLAVAAAVWFTEGGLRGAVCGTVLLGAVVVTDLIAERLREGRRDRLDLWLAAILGRLREYVVYAGLAIGGTAAGVADAWAWAAGALIVLALRDSIGAARGARVGEPEWTPESGLDRPIDAVDPSRHPDDRWPGDPSLTAELLGDPGGADGGDDAGDGAEGRVTAEPRTAPGTPPDIRTVPRGEAWPGWETGAAEVLGPRSADDPESPEEPGNPEDSERPGAPERPAGPAAGDRPRSTTRVSAAGAGALPLVRLAAFPQAVRFGVVALTITIWDARVTFIALIVGCALAITGDLAAGPARDTTR